MLAKVETPGFQPEKNNRVLTSAVLFEETFSIDWIVELTGDKPSQVLMALEETVRKGWAIKEEAGCFRFIDLAKKEALRNAIDNNKKQQLKHRVVDILIRELEDNENKPITLAHHLLSLKNDLKQCKWLVKAGDLYLKHYNTEAALECYTKILIDLASLKTKEANQLYAEVAIKYSKTSTARHHTSKVISVLEEAIARSENLENQETLPLLKMHLAKNEWLCSRYCRALKNFENAWSKCNELKTPKLLRSAANFSTFFLYWQGRFRDAVGSYEQAVTDVEISPKGRFPLLGSLTVGYCYTQIGQLTQGLGMLDAIQKICEERGDGYLACHAKLHIGIALADVCRLDEALHHLNSSVEQASQVHNNWVRMLGILGLAYTYFLKGHDDKSLSHLLEYIKQINEVHVTVRNVPYLLELSWAVKQGKLPQIQDFSFENELKSMLRVKNVLLKGVAYRYKAFFQKENGLPSEKICRSLKLSVKYLKDSGHEIELGKTKLALARHYLSLQKNSEAKTMAEKSFKHLSSISEKLFPNDLRNLVDDSSFNKPLLKEILNLGQEIISIRETKELVQKIMSTVNKLTGAERGAIFLITDDTDPPKFRLRASKNLTTRQINHASFESSIQLIEEVVSKGKGLIRRVNYFQDSEDFSEEIIRSRICVPMIYRDKVVGVLYHDNRLLSNAFKESDLELISYFAALAAIAMDNAKVCRENEQLNRKLKEEKLYYQQQALQSFDFEKIVGESPAIKKVLGRIESVAKTDSTVLIQGETGVGKELIARAIHLNSHRNEKPFIAVQCSALPETLIQSELFGHEKGAFTNANTKRIGRFELAEGGTLFLDEIADIPLDIQMQLLRVLQNKEFERVGGTKTIRSDFRLIAATNRSLENQIENNTFRKDLYYRLNVFPIYVPPLRKRKRDIPLLVHHFINLYARKMNKRFNNITDQEMDILIQYDWPGNIRELKNIIERYSILSKEPYFKIPNFDFHQSNSNEKLHEKSSQLSLKDNERNYILKMLQKTGWKVSGPAGAAELLNINPSTLSFRMKKLGIKRPKGFPKRIRANSYG